MGLAGARGNSDCQGLARVALRVAGRWVGSRLSIDIPSPQCTQCAGLHQAETSDQTPSRPQVPAHAAPQRPCSGGCRQCTPVTARPVPLLYPAMALPDGFRNLSRTIPVHGFHHSARDFLDFPEQSRHFGRRMPIGPRRLALRKANAPIRPAGLPDGARWLEAESGSGSGEKDKEQPHCRFSHVSRWSD